MKMAKSYDVTIVGGGLAGLGLTALLSAQGFAVACIDNTDPKQALTEKFDGRTTAISWASQKVLETAGVWGALAPDACPINDIQILDGDSPVLLEFESQDVGGQSFGWIIENRLIRKALYKSVAKSKNVDFFAPARVTDFSVDDEKAVTKLADGSEISSKLIVGADGKNSFTREWMDIPVRGWSYNQHAIVAIIKHEKLHQNIAIEHFRAEGPFAVLPMTDAPDGAHRSSLVWTQHGSKDKSALSYDEDTFNMALNSRFPKFYGDVKCISQRFAYPLGLKHAYSYIGERMCLVAEAAHAMHPIAGQGLNMGFRDIAELATLLISAREKGRDIGASSLLKSYQQARRADNTLMMGATDSLNKLFSNRMPGLGPLRKLGVRAVSQFPPAKQFFMKQAMGATGLLPTLIQDK